MYVEYRMLKGCVCMCLCVRAFPSQQCVDEAWFWLSVAALCWTGWRLLSFWVYRMLQRKASLGWLIG